MIVLNQGLPFSVWTHKHTNIHRGGSHRGGVVCERVCVGHLEHQSTHAEDHAEQVHVVRRGVLQCGISVCAGRLVPATPHRM